MAYYDNDEDYEDPSEPYDDEGDALEQEQAQLEAEMAEAEAEQQRQLEIEEKLLRNKLKRIVREIGVSSRTTLKPAEKKVMKQSKAFPKLKTERKAVDLMIAANHGKNVSKLMSIAPIIPYILIGGLIVFMLFAVVAAIGAIAGEPGENSNSQYGVTGEHFYGVRMVYDDEEEATKNIIEDYVEMLKNSAESVKQINGVAVDSEPYGVAIELNLAIPNEDFDYSSFDETTFSVDYKATYDIVKVIAEKTYEIDNGEAYTGSTLVECVNGIKFFGVEKSETATVVSGELNKLITFTATNADGAVTDETILSKIKTEIEKQVETKISDLFNNKYTLRTEKLFVKDYILESESSRVSNIPAENYVAMIFMPKVNVEFTKLSFVASNADVTNFKISINGNDFSNGENIAVQSGQQAWMYEYNALTNPTATAFTDIDTNNLSALSNGLSLFDILELENVDHTFYLETVDENPYLTLKRNGVIVDVENDQPFNFVEYETYYK